MATTTTKIRAGGVVCDDQCGCPSPCPGGTTCRCALGSTAAGGSDYEHKKCPCGEHCGCNPCHCSKTDQEVTTTAGTTTSRTATCKCGPGCNECPACAT